MIADEGIVRVTASLTRSQEAALKELAQRNRVSVAWLVRYAVDLLIDGIEETQLPLDLRGRS
ncbi:ribbon-helix-helix protein, CopG family [Sphingomicrobium clamense]|uniref:Ribbon-helix-helix protein, CopG family n=1 Tax=Sphingomicrobium clamense TaxID=2851013 RepID=A0ABS6V7I6_9SPHN|nr:ribbon-helix-helix protein, CopG family [Sphingomicrobium sp. B8]